MDIDLLRDNSADQRIRRGGGVLYALLQRAVGHARLFPPAHFLWPLHHQPVLRHDPLL